MTLIKQANFILLQQGDLVYDIKLEREGRIENINEEFGSAVVKNEQGITHISKIHQLIKIDTTEEDERTDYELVKEFHQSFNHPLSEVPTTIDAQRGLNRTVWTGEELVEFLHALSKDKEEFAKLYYGFLEGLKKAYMKSLDTEFIDNAEDRVVAMADALVDTSYFLNGTFVEIGVDPRKPFQIVHQSNMSKLFTEDGVKVAKYREDGKVLKSPEFFAPEDKLKEEIVRQINGVNLK